MLQLSSSANYPHELKERVYRRLVQHKVRPTVQRVAIMEYLLTHATHPTAEEIYNALCHKISTLSKTTVYNTLRLFADNKAAQILTIDDHHVCYDGDIRPHVHFICKECGRVIDLFDEEAPQMKSPINIGGNIVTEKQIYYKGICSDCATDKDRRMAGNSSAHNPYIN